MKRLPSKSLSAIVVLFQPPCDLEDWVMSDNNPETWHIDNIVKNNPMKFHDYTFLK